jgi:glyoxylase-like metal-dependent hydrolase (beta-lactamase superfamily II)
MTKPVNIFSNIYLIGGPELSYSYDCLIYLIDFGDLVIIDTGVGLSSQLIEDNIISLGFDPNKIKTVIATHSHFDHIGSLHFFRDKYHAQIVAHELDAESIEQGTNTAAEVYNVKYIPCPVDTKIKGETETLHFGNNELNIIHTPGHTEGSIALYMDTDDKRVLFGQDIHGPYLPEWGADVIKARKSLQKMINLKADILCEGHFGIYQPANEVQDFINKYLKKL